MTDLMEDLFDYLRESRVGDYLAVDPEYRTASARTDQWSMDLPSHLDEEGRALFERLDQAFFDESECKQRAMFQATLALLRELYGMLRP